MMHSLEKSIRDLISTISPADADRKACALNQYCTSILEWNKKVNLTANRDEDTFFVRNVADSLSALSISDVAGAAKVADVGSGAGFPGVPLAVCLPGTEFTLIDSVGKKLKIVDECALAAGIDNVSSVHARAEDLGHDDAYREKFDGCVARAVSELSVLCEYCLPLVRVGGLMIAYKSIDTTSEIDSASNAIHRLGGGAVEIIDGKSIPIYREHQDLSGHVLITIRKNRHTPSEYPRKAGTPKNHPL